MKKCGCGKRYAFTPFVLPPRFWMQVWELVWVGDGFLPEFVGEGWWLEKNLADWRWMNEGPYWQERVWDWGCAARGVGVCVWAGHLRLGTMVENVAIQRATPQGAVQTGMCAIAFSLPSSASFFSFSSFVQARGGMLGSDGLP